MDQPKPASVPAAAPALRKRTQINKANHMVFLWVAGASVILGFALVAAIFLGQRLVYNEKVLTAKADTIHTLKADNQAIPDLEDNVRALNANEALASVKANDSDQALQVVLDALPSGANSPAFGASMQQKLLANIPGLQLDSLDVTPVAGVETTSDQLGDDTSTGDNTIGFTFKVEGNKTALQTVLSNLERSIRPITLDTVHIQGSLSSTQPATLTVAGETYYQPAVNFQLQDKVVKK